MSDSESESSSEGAPQLPFPFPIPLQGHGHGITNLFRILGPMMIGNGAPFLAQVDANPTPEKEAVRALRVQHRETDNYAKTTQKFLESSLESLDRLNSSARSGELDAGVEGKEILTQLNTVQEKVNKTLHEFYFQLLEEADLIKKLIDHVQPPTLPLFMKKWQPLLETRSSVDVHPSNKMNCIICSDNTANVIIKRDCTKALKGSSCEDKECHCGAICCRDCMVHHFWSASDNGKKSYARCPHCRAEFCMIDLQNVHYTESAPKRKELGTPTPAAAAPSSSSSASPGNASRLRHHHSSNRNAQHGSSPRAAPAQQSYALPSSTSSRGRHHRREREEEDVETPPPARSAPPPRSSSSGGPPPSKHRKR